MLTCGPSDRLPARKRRIDCVYWRCRARISAVGQNVGKESPMRIGRVGILGVLLLIALPGIGAKGTAEKPAPVAGGLQEAEVTGVLVDSQSDQPLVVLQGKR